MKRYRVTCGEYQTVVSESNITKAAELAIRLYELNPKDRKLGVLCLSECLESLDDHGYILTETLIVKENYEKS